MSDCTSPENILYTISPIPSFGFTYVTEPSELSTLIFTSPPLMSMDLMAVGGIELIASVEESSTPFTMIRGFFFSLINVPLATLVIVNPVP